MIFFSIDKGLCINTLKNWDHVCCVVEANFLIQYLFSFPAHTPTTQLTTPTTSAPTKATPAVAINTHMSHLLTGHVTKSSTKAKATETPDVTLSNTTPRSTKVAGNTSVDPTIEGKDDPIDDRVMNGTVVYIVVSVILGVLAILLIALCWYRKYRYV